MNDTPKILIVDDEPNVLYTLEMILLAEPYDISYASNGKDALAAVEASQPDLILLDVMMPGMSGFEVSSILKRDERWRSIPIILVTALSRKEDLIRGLESGADEFVSKPVHGPELRARVRSMLRQKKMYDALQQTLELREDMANMIIHDMRNPLSSLMLFSDLLARMPGATPKAEELHKRIRLQAQRLNNFLTDLLLLAKMQSGQLLLNRENTGFVDLFNGAISNHQVLADAKDIRLAQEFQTDEREYPLDYKLFLRTLDNLLSNAIKFSPQNSTVTLRLRQEAEVLLVQVLDNGPGIPPRYRETIFEKYEIGPQHDSSVSQIGLGLAFCRQVVRGHGGQITVSDNDPTGAIFTIALQRKREAALSTA